MFGIGIASTMKGNLLLGISYNGAELVCHLAKSDDPALWRGGILSKEDAHEIVEFLTDTLREKHNADTSG